MKKHVLKFVSLVATAVMTCAIGAIAQNGCDFPTAASRDAFLRFDREFRAALNENDPGKLALLIRYPLRVSDANGKYLIEDPGSLARRVDTVFPQKIRQAILEKPAQALPCNVEGIAYGNGVVWVGWPEHGYAVSAVNLPGEDSRGQSRVQFTCNFDKGRAVIEGSGDKDLKLRLWTSPRLLTDEPNIEAADGSARTEGTDACAHRIWTFSKSGIHYKVEELGCADETIPNNAIGRFEAVTAGQPESSYCF